MRSNLCLRKIADSDGEERLKVGVRTRRESKEALTSPCSVQATGDQATTQAVAMGMERGKEI